MWAALAGAIVFEVIGDDRAARVGGVPQADLDHPRHDRLPRVVLPSVADAGAGHARRHRVRRLDGVRCGTGRGRREVAVREPLTWLMGLGIALIVAGVLTIEMVGAAG